MNDKSAMSPKKKMFAFIGAVGVVLVALIVLLTVLLAQSCAQDPAPDSSVPESSAAGTSEAPSAPSGTGTAAVDSSDEELSAPASGTSAVSAGTTTAKPKNTTTVRTAGSSAATGAASSGNDPAPNGSTYNLLQDPTFKNGFRALGLDASDGGANGRAIFNPLESNGRQYWNLASWASRYAFGDMNYTKLEKLGGGVFRYVNPTKEFTFDTNTGAMVFTGITSKCYDAPRTGSEPWFHLLIEQSFRTADSKVSELSRVQLSLSNRLTMFKDNMGDAFNPNAHAAQFLMYLMVTNKDSSSKDYNRYIWFGIPLFDNRYEWMDYSAMLDKGTNSLMVGIGTRVLYEENGKNNCWKNGKINASPQAEWSSFSIDLLPMVPVALETAHYKGYLTDTTEEQLYITGMNLGWEIPGSYDATMEVKDFSIMVTKK